MSLMKRASVLLKANINHLLDSAEDPAVMIKQLIHDMEEAMAELRGETVKAVARQKQLEKKCKAAAEQASELEEKAVLALNHGNKDLARQILNRRVDTLKSAAVLTDELDSATGLATRLKKDLARMQQQSGVARRKKDELVRRQRAAQAQLRTAEAARRSADAVSAATGQIGEMHGHQTAYNDYADDIGAMEAQAEAARELADEANDGEAELNKLVQNSEVDRELERLEQKRASGS